MRNLAIITAVALTACATPPTEAPQDLDTATATVVRTFAAEDTAELKASLVVVKTELDKIDLAGDKDDRSFTLSKLAESDLGGMTATGFDLEAQIPIALAGLSTLPFDRQLELIPETNHVCIESATTKFYSREFLDGADPDAFVAGTIDWISTVNEVRKESPLGSVWYDMNKDFRQLQLDDGTDVLLARSWLPEVFPTDNGNGSWDQTFVLETWFADGATTARYTAYWSSVTLSVVGDDLWGNLVRNGLDESAEFGDDYLNDFAEEVCNEDRDAVIERE